MTIQTKCDRCNNIGGYARVNWSRPTRFREYPVYKDLCKDCFEYLFPEWKEKEYKGNI